MNNNHTFRWKSSKDRKSITCWDTCQVGDWEGTVTGGGVIGVRGKT
jgi:hypothetical protein